MAFLGGGVYVLRPHVHKKITNWAKGNIDQYKKLRRRLRSSRTKDTIAISKFFKMGTFEVEYNYEVNSTKLNKLIKINEWIIR